jgi:hypothetical protein
LQQLSHQWPGVAREACSGVNDGKFALEWGAIVRTDLDGDPELDRVLNEWGFACSSDASLYCGTGGCESHFLVGNRLTSLLTRGWEVATFGPASDREVARCSQADIRY